jgi:hypothetical protein
MVPFWHKLAFANVLIDDLQEFVSICGTVEMEKAKSVENLMGDPNEVCGTP